MERRKFLGLLSGFIGGIAIEKAIPFNRAWSFPKEIVRPKFATIQLVETSGSAWVFDPSTAILIRSTWKRDAKTGLIWQREEVERVDGTYEALEGWRKSPQERVPIVRLDGLPITVEFAPTKASHPRS